ncbi:hypothetical protein B4U79_16902, partial [Dinothrombium tinctorium]
SFLKKVLVAFPMLTRGIGKKSSSGDVFFHISIEKIIEEAIAPLIEVNSLEEAKEAAYRRRPYFKMHVNSPLLRLQVIRITSDNLANLMVVIYLHHIIVDEISLRALEKAIHCFLNDSEFIMENEVNKYAGLMVEINTSLDSVEKQKCLKNFVEKYLVSNSANSCLGFSSETWSPVKTFEAKRNEYKLELDIHKICEKLSIDSFHFYFCCYLLTLKRYLAENDLLVCIPVTKRSHKPTGELGSLFDFILYRYEFKSDHNLKEFMLDVHFKWTNNHPKNFIPLSDVLSYLKHKKQMAGLKMHNAFSFDFKDKNDSHIINITSKHAKFPFFVNICENSNAKLEIKVEWATDIIDESIIENFASSFINTCTKITQNFETLKEVSISSIDVMNQEEKRQILSFNRRIEPIPNYYMHRLFEKHCNENGDKIAVICEERKISYNKLNEMAIVIAAYLLKVIPEEDISKKPIIVMMERNEWIIASILAIWKIGGFFLPISDDMQQKLLQIYADPRMQINIVLTNLNNNFLKIDIPEKLNVIDVRTIFSSGKKYHVKNNQPATSPGEMLAYMFLTSGTTGEPKRCMITHKALSILLESVTRDFKLLEFEVNLLQWIQISFDVFILDLIIGILAVPGTITIIPGPYRQAVFH